MIEQFRPRVLGLMTALAYLFRRGRPRIDIGRRCRFERGCSISVGKQATLSLGSKVVLRAGAVIGLSRGASLVLGDDAELRHYAIIECGGRVSIGRRTVIGAYNWLQGSGEIEIGDDVIIGPGVRIISTSHDTRNPDLPFAAQPLIAGKVSIGSNVWIGADAVVLKGVTIGPNVVVGAGALVNADLEAGGVYVGSPARRIKDVHPRP